jgi:DoxX-like family
MAITTGRIVWGGRAVSALVTLVFAFSALMKWMGGAEVKQGMGHLGLPESLIIPLAILEVACVVIYLIPATSVLGAILLTGYMGGAICTHLRVGDPFVIQILLGVFVWLGLYLREKRLKGLLPLRTT